MDQSSKYKCILRATLNIRQKWIPKIFGISFDFHLGIWSTFKYFFNNIISDIKTNIEFNVLWLIRSKYFKYSKCFNVGRVIIFQASWTYIFFFALKKRVIGFFLHSK